MRIVAGAAKGRRLRTPPGARTRPTADRVKEAWFSSLAPYLTDAHVLDLYAGSGQLGLEARSRGAARVTLVERDRAALAALRANVDAVGLDGVTVAADEVARVLAGDLADAPFDVVVADPPYDLDPAGLGAMLARLVPHLAPGAVVTVERARRSPPPAWPSQLLAAEPRRYGDTLLHRAVLADVPEEPT